MEKKEGALRNHTHAVMFHHFHNEQHPRGQGSLSAQQFTDMLDWVSDRYNLLNADEYLYKLESKKLDAVDICLTFDDALLCQSEIAAPILKQKKIQAFFFVYSSPFLGNPDLLEIYRYFRTTEFDSVDSFYEKFFTAAAKLCSTEYEIANTTYEKDNYLTAYPFYTASDKWFRYLRDAILGKEKYEEIMRVMMMEHNFQTSQVLTKLWMNNASLATLKSDGHIIGLHSNSHPTMLHLLDKKQQEEEYEINFRHLTEVLNTLPIAMSHPCGNYNSNTLDILKNKKIGIGFRSNNSVKEIKSNLEIPREDHANILKEMSQ